MPTIIDDKVRNILSKAEILQKVEFLKFQQHKGEIFAEFRKILDKNGYKFTDREIEEIIHSMVGLGPLQPYYEDKEINEIIVQGGRIRVEKNGRLIDTGKTLTRDEVYAIIKRVAMESHLQVGINRPILSCELPGTQDRFIGIVEPIVEFPQINIRIRTRKYFSLDQLVNMGMLSNKMATFLQELVKVKANIIVAGVGSSGKTTLVDALLPYIPKDSMTVIVEDVRELHIHDTNITSLTPNIERSKTEYEETTEKIDISSLINLIGTRVRADRVILGEIRTATEVQEFLNTISIGSDGVITTMHANSPRDVLSRIENLAVGKYPNPSAVRSILGPNLDVVVQTARIRDQFRIVEGIYLIDYDHEHDQYSIQPFFETRVLEILPTGVKVKFQGKGTNMKDTKLYKRFVKYYGESFIEEKMKEIAYLLGD